MAEENRNSSGLRNAPSAEAERARLRRNQRNSRARKQAYIESLEKRWNECVRLGAEATVEMQMEARRVQEENRLLRTVLRNQGFDDISIQRALESAKLAESSIDQTKQSNPNGPGSTPSVDDNAPPPLWPLDLPSAGRPQALDIEGDMSQSLVLHDWLADLCNIKDAFGAEVNFNDPTSLDPIGMPFEDPMQFTTINDTQYDLPYFSAQTAHPTSGSTTLMDSQWGQRNSPGLCPKPGTCYIRR
ncbi:hypothetical protein F5Y06DRAFT_273031 [Hypoxylon sp. FL0890]|nr:hypothetical protein F5Y06DRAFT_273031 [Hypoxylon sp. FL0890]